MPRTVVFTTAQCDGGITAAPRTVPKTFFAWKSLQTRGARNNGCKAGTATAWRMGFVFVVNFVLVIRAPRNADVTRAQ